MRTTTTFVALLFCLQLARAQTVSSGCHAADSIVRRYKDDAARLAIKAVLSSGNTYKDSVVIYRPLYSRYLNALIAVFNATLLPARDTVMRLRIHTTPNPILNNIYIVVDSTALWVQNLHNNIFPVGNIAVDHILDKYQFNTHTYYTYNNVVSHAVSLSTDSNYNLLPLVPQFTVIPGVYRATFSAFATDGNGITDSLAGGYTQLVYCYGWGDCFNGCFYKRYWKFNVYNDCSVAYMGSHGDNVAPLFTTGIVQNSEQLNSISIFPNPVPGKLNIEATGPDAGSIKLSIMNTLGQTVFSSVEQLQNARAEVDVTFLQSGIYYLNAGNGTKMQICKFIKE